jgi:hypothetical protein
MRYAEALEAALERIAAAPSHPEDPKPWYVTVAREALGDGDRA